MYCISKYIDNVLIIDCVQYENFFTNYSILLFDLSPNYQNTLIFQDRHNFQITY